MVVHDVDDAPSGKPPYWGFVTVLVQQPNMAMRQVIIGTRIVTVWEKNTVKPLGGVTVRIRTARRPPVV
jgi:hypothetical protein